MIRNLRSLLFAVFAVVQFVQSTARADVVYVGQGDGYVSIIDQGMVKLWSNTPVMNLTGLTLADDGTVYAADFFHGNVYPIMPSGASMGVVGMSFTTSSPVGLAYQRGQVYVANSLTGGNITSYAPTLYPATTFASGLDNPYGLAFDASGNLYVALPTAHEIVKYNSTGTSLLDIGTGTSQARGLAVDSKGNLYATDFGGGLKRFSASTGNFLDSIMGFDGEARAVAIGSNDTVYVSTSTGHVYEYDPSLSLTAPVMQWDGITGANFLAVQPSAVPEPSSLLSTMFAALGLLGAWRRGWLRRMQSADAFG